jgi:hypothetical protein
MSHFNLPRLHRQPIRPDKEPGVDLEIWSPDWKCFCCHDSGVVRPKLASLVIPDYDPNADKPPACYRCDAGSYLTSCEEYDQRFHRGICNELDRIERNDWTETIKAKQQQILDLKSLSRSKSIRQRDRTSSEEMEAQRRHEEACNAAPEKLREMARAYLGDEYMKGGPS